MTAGSPRIVAYFQRLILRFILKMLIFNPTLVDLERLDRKISDSFCCRFFGDSGLGTDVFRHLDIFGLYSDFVM